MTKKIIFGVVAVLLVVGLVTGIGFMTKGFTEKDPDNWTIRDRNEENLFTLEDYTLEGTKNTGDGITVTANKDGSITIDGKNHSTEEIEIEIGKITLEAGTYTFTSGYSNSGLYSAYLNLQTSGGEYSADFGGDNGTFTLSAEATGTVYLVIASDFQFNNKTLYPVIAEGDSEVSFYE